jgi:hypothetical protein
MNNQEFKRRFLDAQHKRDIEKLEHKLTADENLQKIKLESEKFISQMNLRKENAVLSYQQEMEKMKLEYERVREQQKDELLLKERMLERERHDEVVQKMYEEREKNLVDTISLLTGYDIGKAVEDVAKITFTICDLTEDVLLPPTPAPKPALKPAPTPGLKPAPTPVPKPVPKPPPLEPPPDIKGGDKSFGEDMSAHNLAEELGDTIVKFIDAVTPFENPANVFATIAQIVFELCGRYIHGSSMNNLCNNILPAIQQQNRTYFEKLRVVVEMASFMTYEDEIEEAVNERLDAILEATQRGVVLQNKNKLDIETTLCKWLQENIKNKKNAECLECYENFLEEYPAVTITFQSFEKKFKEHVREY